jgi:hypothetical protein
MAPVGNWSTEAELDAMKRRGWVERRREELPHERRILVRLWHPHQTLGEGSDRYYTAVETFRSLPLDDPGPSQLSLFESPSFPLPWTGPSSKQGHSGAKQPEQPINKARAQHSPQQPPPQPKRDQQPPGRCRPN